MDFKTVFLLCFVLEGPLNGIHAHTNSRTHLQVNTSTISVYEEHTASIFTLDDSNSTAIASEPFEHSTEMDTSVFEEMSAHNQGFISEEVYEAFKITVWRVSVPLLTFIGIFGNMSGLWFVFCSNLRQPFYLFLLALMAVDLFYLIISLVINSLKILEYYNKPTADYISCYVSAHLRSLQSLTYSTCAHLITMMSFERLINVLFPVKIRASRLRKSIVLIILVILLINIILLIPGFLILEPKETFNPLTNDTVCRPVFTKWAKENISFRKKYVVVMLVVARFVPGTATTIANILISILLTKQRSQRAILFQNKATRGDQYEQFKSTVTLIVLSVSLLLSLIPSALATIFSMYYPHIYGKGGSQYYTYLFVLDLGYFLRVISTSHDFFIYVMLSKSSQLLFKQLCMSKCCTCVIPTETESRGTSSDILESLENTGIPSTNVSQELPLHYDESSGISGVHCNVIS